MKQSSALLWFVLAVTLSPGCAHKKSKGVVQPLYGRVLYGHPVPGVYSVPTPLSGYGPHYPVRAIAVPSPYKHAKGPVFVPPPAYPLSPPPTVYSPPPYPAYPTSPAYHLAYYPPPTTYQPPSYSPPSYPEPAYHAPSYSEPAYHAPSYPEPAYHAPSYPEPPYDAPSYPEPAYHAQSYSEPVYQVPPSSEPAYHVPSNSEPAYHVPSNSEPAYHVPSHSEPAYHVPSHSEPAYHVPSNSEPAYHVPSYPEPAYPTSEYATQPTPTTNAPPATPNHSDLPSNYPIPTTFDNKPWKPVAAEPLPYNEQPAQLIESDGYPWTPELENDPQSEAIKDKIPEVIFYPEKPIALIHSSANEVEYNPNPALSNPSSAELGTESPFIE